MLSIHGHRGSRGTHPENTLKAFEEAAASQAAYVECDVHLTADKECVVFHDFTLDPPLCTALRAHPADKIQIEDLTLSEIQEFWRVGLTPMPRFPRQSVSPKGERIVSLQELGEWQKKEAPHCFLNIEIKRATTSRFSAAFFAKRVTNVVHEHDLSPRTLLQSFDLELMEALSHCTKNFQLSCLWEQPYTLNQLLFSAEKCKTGRVGPDAQGLTHELLSGLRASHIHCLPWTINSLEHADFLAFGGVEGLITDYPRDLVEHFRRYSTTDVMFQT